jgi:hypothetical protein
MTKCSILVLAVAAACTGCATCSLARHTLNQIQTSGDYRSQEVVDCLAAVAANPEALPSFALLADGVTRIQDMESVSPITTWTRLAKGFATQSLAVTLSRSPQGLWTLGPVAEHEKLEALRSACRWVLYGPEHADSDAPGILADITQDPLPRPHFNVANRLERLPQGWLHIGQLKDVPLSACYKGHCGEVWVWVTADGMEGLADFTLVLHDIATLDSSAVYAPPPLVTMTRVVTTQPLTDPAKGGNAAPTKLLYSETRVIRPEFKEAIEQKIHAMMSKGQKGPMYFTWEEWLRYTIPYRGVRTNVSPQGGGTSTPQPAKKPVIEITGPGVVKDSVELIPPSDITLIRGGKPPTVLTVKIKRNTYFGTVPISFSFSGLGEGSMPKGVTVKPVKDRIDADKTSLDFILTAGDGAEVGTKKAKVTIETPEEGENAEEFNVTVKDK